MFYLTDEHIDFIISDVAKKGITEKDLQENIVDHICCVLEEELTLNENFKAKYKEVVSRFFKHDLKEIQKEANFLLASKTIDWLKKLLKFSGVFSVVFLAIGVYSKFNHLKGTGMLLLIGVVLFSLVFLPSLILLKLKDTDVKQNILLVTIGFLFTLFGGIGCLFKIMQWPFATILVWISLGGLMFLFAPFYYITMRKKPGSKLTAFINVVLMLVVGMLLFVLTI